MERLPRQEKTSPLDLGLIHLASALTNTDDHGRHAYDPGRTKALKALARKEVHGGVGGRGGGAPNYGEVRAEVSKLQNSSKDRK